MANYTGAAELVAADGRVVETVRAVLKGGPNPRRAGLTDWSGTLYPAKGQWFSAAFKNMRAEPLRLRLPSGREASCLVPNLTTNTSTGEFAAVVGAGGPVPFG